MSTTHILFLTFALDRMFFEPIHSTAWASDIIFYSCLVFLGAFKTFHWPLPLVMVPAALNSIMMPPEASLYVFPQGLLGVKSGSSPPFPSRLITKYFIFFDACMGYIFLPCYMLCNFWLDVICCKFYLVGCWTFLYFYRCFWALNAIKLLEKSLIHLVLTLRDY